jgi:elongator complex protein 3
MVRERFYSELVKRILSGKLGKKSLESTKNMLSKKHGLSDIPKNAKIIEWSEKQDFSREKMEIIRRFLQTKPVRTGSGVSVIAVMAMGNCPGKCIYCPRGKNSPQSYTGVEPATMRAKRSDYDPKLQVLNRLRQLEITGHETEKCELIIMGGTFPSYSKKKQESFVKGCFDALNGNDSRNLKEAQRINESSSHRCVGLTIETRPDYCGEKHITEMLRLGATRVELGVQAIDDKILKKVCRGHPVSQVALATNLLKDSGLKVCYHLMPGLTGLFGKVDIAYEKRMIDEVFSNPDFKPDLLKIYPALVIPGTGLHRLWKKRKYSPITIDQTCDIIMHLKQTVPKWVRIQRMQRDISSKEIVAGPILTNLRQHVNEIMKESDLKCNCIRCREIGHANKKPEKIKLVKTEYSASGGKEIFLSYEDVKNNILIGYIRLRISKKPFIMEIRDSLLVRELHVYGQEVSIGMHEEDKWQHRGYGKMLLEKAEEIARSLGMKKVVIMSGVGTREYYRNLGYELKGFHMVKILSNN